jgi:GT2 family glycosyltransferase
MYNLDELITVIISTKNRWPDLERALSSLRKQTLKHQIIIMDDNSGDGTYEKVRDYFPEVEIFTFKDSCGYIVRRNEAVKLACTPYVLSIDDDCTLEDPEILYQMAAFCQETWCAAVAWPYIDVNVSDEVQSISPADGFWQTFTFKGCAFIVNRHQFLDLGGFRRCFVHQGEEEDFCIRLLDKGHPVLLGKGHAIHHHESPKRSWERMDFYGSRNIILFALFNVPLVFLPLQVIGSAIKCFIYGFQIKRPYQKARGVVYGLFDGLKLFHKERCAVSLRSFLKFRKLKRRHQRVGKHNWQTNVLPLVNQSSMN